MAAQQFNGFSPMLEQLEQRRLLSAVLVEGQLTIVGTHKPDTIKLYIHPRTQDRITVEINKFVRQFTLADVERINIQAGQGDDFVQIDPGHVPLNQPTRLYGSGGDDTIIGGRGTDRIYGGSGSDRISGNNARDIIYGEAGGDTLDGGQGNDYLDGGDHNDMLNGGLGLDYHYGQAGDDYIFSKDGATDHVNGGPGVDEAETDSIDFTLVSIEDLRNSRRPT